MRALVTTKEPPGVVLGDAPEPREVASDAAVVAVKAVSLNRGEARALGGQEPGTVPGWDVAGVVEIAAADGSGPRAGTRVVGLVRRGAWAERVAVRTRALAALPDSVSFAAASTLPIAGVTALQALRRGGLLLGRKVLVTGAAGGVGRFAVQLAHLSGAYVIAVARDDDRAAGLRALGADEIVHELEAEGPPLDLVLESVGGQSLANALARVSFGGDVVSYGNSSAADARVTPRSFFGRAHGARLHAYLVFEAVDRGEPTAADLQLLAKLVAKGRLDPQIAMQGSWRDPVPAIQALLERRVNGKAVLLID
jgi:NADPH:quinone reductase-like Zn-dependent oxidoreductase